MGPDFSGRVKRLKQMIKNRGVDALMISSMSDIHYYTGSSLSSDFAFLLVGLKSKPLLNVSSLSNYDWKIKTAKIRFFSSMKDMLKEFKGYKTIGFDEKSTSADFFIRLKKSGIKLSPMTSSIKSMRLVKDDWEISQIRKAVRITEDLFSNVRLIGKTELDVAKWVNKKVMDLGLKNSFPPIITSGKNSAFIHCSPGSRKIRAGDLVIMDIGVRYNGYCSDLTRTFCKKPDKRKERFYEDIRNVQEQVIDNARAGIRFDTLDNFFQTLFDKLGYEKMHSIGHGVGLSIHEKPVAQDTLSNGTVFTVEPGAYIKNWGGCRIEDVVYIKNNKARLLSTFPRDLSP